MLVKPFTTTELETMRNKVIKTYGHRESDNIEALFTIDEMKRILQFAVR